MTSHPHWEDFRLGETIELGTVVADRDEMIAFAERYDPQPFHLSDEDKPPFGGLVASGWLTAALWMRLYVDAVLGGADSRGSPGLDDLRWLLPVRPGDRLSGRMTVTGTHPSARHADRGTVLFVAEMTRGDGEAVMTMTGRGLFGRRPVHR
ncbi:MAG TPA: MaoC/PaaZ C-terminal domain-containing protein [Acidimicrobiales bacterium]|jgi:acyl dehydratase|nr:MaoC/PaaZ C-terminal domain-containing protein [Acidimicrobiales bacterium]